MDGEEWKGGNLSERKGKRCSEIRNESGNGKYRWRKKKKMENSGRRRRRKVKGKDLKSREGLNNDVRKEGWRCGENKRKGMGNSVDEGKLVLVYKKGMIEEEWRREGLIYLDGCKNKEEMDKILMIRLKNVEIEIKKKVGGRK